MYIAFFSELIAVRAARGAMSSECFPFTVFLFLDLVSSSLSSASALTLRFDTPVFEACRMDLWRGAGHMIPTSEYRLPIPQGRVSLSSICSCVMELTTTHNPLRVGSHVVSRRSKAESRCVGGVETLKRTHLTRVHVSVLRNKTHSMPEDPPPSS